MFKESVVWHNICDQIESVANVGHDSWALRLAYQTVDLDIFQTLVVSLTVGCGSKYSEQIIYKHLFCEGFKQDKTAVGAQQGLLYSTSCINRSVMGVEKVAKEQ